MPRHANLSERNGNRPKIICIGVNEHVLTNAAVAVVVHVLVDVVGLFIVK